MRNIVMRDSLMSFRLFQSLLDLIAIISFSGFALFKTASNLEMFNNLCTSFSSNITWTFHVHARNLTICSSLAASIQLKRGQKMFWRKIVTTKIFTTTKVKERRMQFLLLSSSLFSSSERKKKENWACKVSLHCGMIQKKQVF